MQESSDRGYETADTLSGTRLDTPAKFVGSDIQDVNQQMMSDLALFNMNDVIDFTTNAVAYDDGRTGQTTDMLRERHDHGSFEASVRGALITSSSRDFFVTHISDDAYDIDRISVDRGPNSILFGFGSPQGIVNSVSTWAAMKDTYELGMRFDNWGSHRESFRLNKQIITDKVAIFLAGLNEDTAHRYLAVRPATSDRLYGAITVKPFADTSIRASFEHGLCQQHCGPSLSGPGRLSAWLAAGSNEIPARAPGRRRAFRLVYSLTAAQTAQKRRSFGAG